MLILSLKRLLRLKAEVKGEENLLSRIRNEQGFLLLTAMIFLFFITNMMLAVAASYESHYRSYDELKIAYLNQTKSILLSLKENKNHAIK
ncbi:hypothetical protein M3603_06020 [Rummeliibacillus stabekisii]|nr:hypothetical protein [Rummeliibacillus stabekisii]